MKQDMTAGNPANTIIRFALPVMLTSIFQQMYNTAAAVIAGRLIGKDALAAIGIADPLMSIAIFLIFGICVGVSVLLAQLYGAKDYEGFKTQTSTALIAGCAFTILLSILCIFISRPVLIAFNTPGIILNDTDRYIKIIFGGLIFSFLYNFYSSALRAIGDSKTPLFFLFISSVLNIALNILFIKVFNMGVGSMAVATVIAQAVSSISCIIYVYMKIPILSLKRNDFIFRIDVLAKTIQYSWASALQQTFLYIGRFLVQGIVNPLGPDVIAAYNTASRVEAIVFAAIDSLAISVSTFSGQNMGAGLYGRIKQGVHKSILINIIFCLALSCVLFIFSPKVMSIFVSTDGTTVIEAGSRYLNTMVWFYIIGSITTIFQGLFRGVGKLSISMIATFLQILVRVFFSYMLVPSAGVSGIGYATGIGWLVMLAFQVFHARKLFRQLSRYEHTKEFNRAV